LNNIVKAWHDGVYKQTGKLVDEGLDFYAFHGIGLASHFKDKVVDFDFAWFPEQRHDGFDLWRLTNFITSQRNKYPAYQDNEKVEKEFTQLVLKGIIAKPILDNSTTLYFFKDRLNESQVIDNTKNPNFDRQSFQKRNWLKRFFNFK
jgi:hypothetical protein